MAALAIPALPAPGCADGRNWKMHENHLEAIALVQKLAFTLTAKDFRGGEVAVLPPFTALRSVQTLIDGTSCAHLRRAGHLPVRLGAYTGDVSGPMLAKLGCQYVLAGTPSGGAVPRRDDDAWSNAKALAAPAIRAYADLCLGEPLEVRQARQQLGLHRAAPTKASGVPAGRWRRW